MSAGNQINTQLPSPEEIHLDDDDGYGSQEETLNVNMLLLFQMFKDPDFLWPSSSALRVVNWHYGGGEINRKCANRFASFHIFGAECCERVTVRKSFGRFLSLD